MTLSPEDAKFIADGLDAIQTNLRFQEAAVQDVKQDLTVAFDQRDNITENTAYHDYYRIEMGTPAITTEQVDGSIELDLTKLVEYIEKYPFPFGKKARTDVPTDAEEVEDLVNEVRADLSSLAAGPVPMPVQSFVALALSDQIDQATWNALSISQRERLAELAAAWLALTAPATSGANGGAGQPTTTQGSATTIESAPGGGVVVDTLRDIAEALPW